MVKLPYLLSLFILLTAFLAGCAAAPSPIAATVSQPATLAPDPTEQSSPTAIPTATTMVATVAPTVEVETETILDSSNGMEVNSMKITIGDTVLTATLAENSSVDALKKALSNGPISVNMSDYGSMEKVGPLGMDLPRNDQQITTEAGDIILYQGSALVIYYAPNSWNFTRLGKINDITAEKLREVLGGGNVTVTLSLP